MSISYIEVYGSHRSEPEGWIARLGEENYFHRFGGESWKVLDPQLNNFAPTLLLVLDLRDPRLAVLKTAGIDELPVCSHIDCSVWDGKQVFQINPQSKTVTLVEREIQDPESWETGFPKPLPEKRLKLFPMDDNDYPIDEERYKRAIENFLCDTSFIRVLGPPLWIDPVLTEEDENPRCSCGSSMRCFCALGQQVKNQEYLDDEPFYIGEGVLYFFFCQKCLQVTVVSQPV